jgi:uncharacterized protein (TIGR03083 family)
VEYEAHIAVIPRESEALAEAARRGLDRPVASCPGWSVADLVGHIGQSHWWSRSTVERRTERPVSRRELPKPPLGPAVVDWFLDGARDLVRVLEDTSADEPVWTWTPNGTARFYARRMANETSVHRWDAEAAVGDPLPIATELAADGVDELLSEMLPFRVVGEPVVGNGETIHLHCTDADGEWLVRLTPDGMELERAHAKGDVAARGTASDLVLFVWGRVPSSGLEVFGDAGLLDRFQALAAM